MGIWQTLTSMVQRFFGSPGAVVGALLLAGAHAVSPQYPSLNAMSTMARFPWVWTCVHCIASDLAARPLKAFRVVNGEEVPVDDPILELLAAPNMSSSGYLLRKQLWVDQLLTGNAYLWRPVEGVAVYRLHPASTKPIPGPLGMVFGFEWTDEAGTVRTLPAAEVVHIRDVSWSDDATSVLGESAIRCLHDDLMIEIGAKKTARENSARGRPDILFSTAEQLGDKGLKPIKAAWQEAMEKRDGAFVVDKAVTATLLSWSPKELEFLQQSAVLRDTILAVFGVPPTRAGVQGANYAVARQEEKAYWERIIGRARIFDDAFTALAAPGVRVAHDFASVEALQVSTMDRILQMQAWIAAGVPAPDAARYVGFVGVPFPAELEAGAGGKPAAGTGGDDEPAEPADKAMAIRSAVWLTLRSAEAAYAGVGEGVDTALLCRSQTEQLFTRLNEAGLEAVAARTWAEELCGIVDEAHRMGLPDAFSEQRAYRMADRVASSLRRAA
jgi:HK97 family phage portal protein